ncbi:MAG TPA: hypothetical protein VHP83_00840 [Aggregatilineaceae bacterium]|nr:hypothetical protein [Aggregatilineaceae bacterium]
MTDLLTLEEQLRKVSSPTLVLNNATTGLDNLNEVLETLCRDGLELSAFNVNRSTRDILLVTGQASILKLNVRVTVEFESVNDQIEMRLEAPMARDWSLGDSFTELQETPLDSLEISEPKFILSTYDYEIGETSVVRGLNFVAGLILGESLQSVKDLVGVKEATIGGSISGSADTVRSFSLMASLEGDAQLGPLTLNKLNISLNASPSEPSTYAAAMTLSGTVTLGDDMTLNLKAEINPPEKEDEKKSLNGENEKSSPDETGKKGSTLKFSAECENLTLKNLGALADLTGTGDMADMLPANLEGVTQFGLKSIEFTVQREQDKYEIDDYSVELYAGEEDGSQDWLGLGENLLAIKNMDITIAKADDDKHPISVTVEGEVKIGARTLSLNGSYPDYDFEVKLADDETIKVPDLLAGVVTDISTPIGTENFEITTLDLKANPRLKTATLTAGFEPALGFILDPLGELRLDALTCIIQCKAGKTGFEFKSGVTLFDQHFDLFIERPIGQQDWNYSGTLLRNENTPFTLPSLVQKVSGSEAIASGLSEFGLNIELSMLQFEVKHHQAGTEIAHFQAQVEWNTGITLLGEIDLNLTALIDLTRTKKNGQLSTDLRVGGVLETGGIKFLDSLQLGVYYVKHSEQDAHGKVVQQNGVLEARLDVGDAHFSTQYASKPNGSTLEFKGTFDNLSLGSILTGMVNLVQPGEGEFKLDAPWDMLNEIKLLQKPITVTLSKSSDKNGILSRTLVLTIEGGIRYKNIFELDTFRLIYSQPLSGKVRRRQVRMRINGTAFSCPVEQEWDVLKQHPPQTSPTKAPPFQLDYMGLGHHVVINQDADAIKKYDLTTIPGVMSALETALTSADESEEASVLPSLLKFDRSCGWLLGAKFSVLNTVLISMIFNDPVLYGMRIELNGKKAKSFAGLKFEILYRRVTDSIGVYHTELVLPDEYRQIEFGWGSVTLPIIVVDIFTNGDFKLDVGFPWNANFSRSFAIQMLPFTGAGGFYFNKLSASTATSVPTPAVSGNFNPVIEFGVGAKFGLGKSFNKGPLRAEIEITLQGILQGVIAQFNPQSPPSEDGLVLYYKIQGCAILLARLYGAVDFKVIRVDVEIILRTTIRFEVEAYQPFKIEFEAYVSVRASIKIVFIRIRFSFSLTVRQSFTIPAAESGPAPWLAGGGGIPEELEGRLVDTLYLSAATVPTPLVWEPVQVYQAKPDLTLVFQPAFTRTANGMWGIALLFIQNALKAEGVLEHEDYVSEAASQNATQPETGFDKLAEALLTWAIYAYLKPPASYTRATENRDLIVEVRKSDLENLYNAILKKDEDPQHPFDLVNLGEFLKKNFNFKITTAGSSATSMTVFPMIPTLQLELPNNTKVIFEDQILTSDQMQFLSQYFARLQATYDRDTAGNGTASAVAADMSVARFIFLDYFTLLIRTAVQYAVDCMEKQSVNAIKLPELLARIAQEGQFNHLAAMLSRFLLHGLRLPIQHSPVENPVFTPLYMLTGQQFTLPPEAGTVTLRDTVPNDWITVENGTYALSAAASLITDLKAGDLSRLNIPALPLDSFTERPKDYTLTTCTAWNDTLWVFDLSSALQRDLRRDADVTLEKIDWDSENREFLTPASGWVTKVDIQLRRIPGSASIYQLIGTTEAHVRLLEQLESDPSVIDTLDLLYLSVTEKESKLVNAQSPTILKTSASRVTITSDGLAEGCDAALENKAQFVRLVREASITTTGGYHLKCENLPETIFSDGLTGHITLLIETSKPAQPYHNALKIGRSSVPAGKPVLYLRSSRTIPVSAIPPGYVGFRLVRPRMDILMDEKDSDYQELLNLYQMLGYRVAESELVETSEGMPIGPLGDDPDTSKDDKLWIYERTIPYYKLVPQSMLGGLNPYAGISPSAALPVQLAWQDIFGNRWYDGAANAPDILLPIRYQDRLIGLNEWSALSETYEFGAAPQTLKITLSFDVSRYKTTASSTPEELQKILDMTRADRLTYRQIYYQISQDDIKFEVATSVVVKDASWFDLDASVKPQIKDFVRQIYTYLEDKENHMAARTALPEPPPLTISLRLDTNGSIQYPANPLFVVTAQFAIVRAPEYVDGRARQQVSEVQRSEAWLTPNVRASISNTAVTTSEPNGSSALRTFAGDFQKTFPGLYLTVGKEEQDQDEMAGSLWAVHFSANSIDYDIVPSVERRSEMSKPPWFFTVRPLANTLLSGIVEINGEERRFEAVDLNVWGRNFLNALESMLAPSSAFVIDRESFSQMMACKKRLAEAIAAQVTSVLDTNDPDRRDNAAGVLREHLLVNLAEGCAIETIVQYDVDVEACPAELQNSSVYLAGKPMLTRSGQHTKNFTLSSTKFSLTKDDTWMNFMFDTPSPEKFEGTALDLYFQPTGLEYVPDVRQKQAPIGLSFILPETLNDRDRNKMGQVVIPVPLRTYPMPPSLVRQCAERQNDEAQPIAQWLANLRKWDYVYTYEHIDVAQDTIESRVYYGAGESSDETTSNNIINKKQQALFSALAKFTEVYANEIAPALMNDKTVWRRFAGLVAAVTNAWEQWAESCHTWDAAPVSALRYEINEQPYLDPVSHQETDNREVTITALSGYTDELPKVRAISDYQSPPDQQGNTFIFKPTGSHFDSIPDRTLEIPDRDLVMHQNVAAAVILVRNKQLLPTQPDVRTNPELIFQTPEVRFHNPLTALLTDVKPHDLTGLLDPTTPHPFYDYLDALFKVLLPDAKENTRLYQLNIGVQYGFRLVDEAETVRVPVLFGMQLAINPAELYLGELVTTIKEWQDKNLPASNDGMYSFDIAIFSGDGKTGVPLLHVTDLRLPLNTLSNYDVPRRE